MTLRARHTLDWITLAAAITAAGFSSSGLLGCGGDGGGFISDNPKGSNNGGAAEDGGGSTGTGSGGATGNPAPSAGQDAERAIAEADIIQLKDNKLYALSQFSGLSIIDVSVRDELKLLGRYQQSGMPFEMYLRDGVVYAMYSSWGQYVHDEATDSYSWIQTSHIEALDVSDPADIQPIGTFDLPGAISDSRIVGDVLYTVTFEDGYCWGCDATPNTTVTSLAVADPGAIAVVDQLQYDDNDPYGYGWRRSVSVTPERMYIAGIEWDGSGEGHSTIQVVDISDPTGQLVEGASVEAVGQIQSRWQMDEHEGVLRVISQPGVWWSNAYPGVQTFNVVSSQSLTPLGYTELQLPKPETLRSVRFDGTRAYAITAEQTDPLFTIDLSNPAQPKQMGELEMPGFIYHMEPRGDRMLALGFDNASQEGSLHVSLFDVSNIAQPKMLKRVGFGGNWSNLAEDQDRIHKAFTILDDLGLILVPYSAYSWEDSMGGCASAESGIQLIDFTQNDLTKRGVASSRGQARRAFVHDQRLFAVSDEQVRTFNVEDRNTPVKATELALATHVSQSVVTGDLVVRMAADWWTNEAVIDVAALSTPGQAEPLGTLDLSVLDDSGSTQGCYSSSYYGARMFANGQNVYLVFPSSDGNHTRVAVIDVSDPSAPTLKGHTELPTSLYSYDGYGAYGQVVASGDAVVQVGSTLVFRRNEAVDYYTADFDPNALRKAWLEVVDLSNPSSPVHTKSIELPEAAGYTQLRITGTTVLTSHWVPLPEDDTKARFYLDRLDVADPTDPELLDPVNVPGSLVSFDNQDGRLLTVDYQRVTLNVTKPEECWAKFSYTGMFEPDDAENYSGPGVCTALHRTWKLVDVDGSSATLLDSKEIDDTMQFSGVMVADDRVFAPVWNYGWYASDSPYPNSYESKLFVVGGMSDGALKVVAAQGAEIGRSTPVETTGQRLVMTSYDPTAISVLDASDLDNLTFEQKGELGSYAFDVTISGDQAFCALGQFGLQVVDIGQ